MTAPFPFVLFWVPSEAAPDSRLIWEVAPGSIHRELGARQRKERSKGEGLWKFVTTAGNWGVMCPEFTAGARELGNLSIHMV